MVIELLLCAIGLVVLSVAADWLVRASSQLAARLRVKPVVIGIVVIGLGTSAPELLVSASAAARGETGIAVGNIVGSNILNLTLILGVAALIAGVRVKASVVARETRLAVAAVVLFALMAWRGLDLLSGAVLTGLLIAALAMLIKWAVADRSTADASPEARDETDHEGNITDITVIGAHPVVTESVWALLGLGGVLLGAQLLVVNVSSIATRLGVSQVVIGLTLVALGTSLPELVTTVQAQRHGESDLVVGNLFGSNLFNSLGGGAVVGLTSHSNRPVTASGVFLAAMVVTAVLAWLLLRRGLRLTRVEGLVLLGAYVLTIPVLLAS
jgi:cation:H+ antiporter